MKLYSCDKDGFNSERVTLDPEDEKTLVWCPCGVIENTYERHIKIVSIDFCNPDGTADIKVVIDDPECDHLKTDYYFIR